MEKENQNQILQNTPNLEILPLGDIGYSLKYTGQAIITTRESINKIIKSIKRFERDNIQLKEEINQLKNELSQCKEYLEQCKKELNSCEKERESLFIKLERFTKNQGNGRPQVLTEEVKRAIITGYRSNMGVMDIYKALTIRGFKGNYETVRKYVRENEDRWRAGM